jgi:hypothetical protein
VSETGLVEGVREEEGTRKGEDGHFHEGEQGGRSYRRAAAFFVPEGENLNGGRRRAPVPMVYAQIHAQIVRSMLIALRIEWAELRLFHLFAQAMVYIAGVDESLTDARHTRQEPFQRGPQALCQ